MKGLKRAMVYMALYSGTLFGMAIHQVWEIDAIDRYAVKLFGLSLIGTALCLLVASMLHRRGLT